MVWGAISGQDWVHNSQTNDRINDPVVAGQVYSVTTFPSPFATAIWHNKFDDNHDFGFLT